MSFFNDEFDLVDDDPFDLFTLSTQVERRSRHTSKPGEAAAEPARDIRSTNNRPRRGGE
jgi:hypothetical protein